ncbi:MAG: poly-gamma-glutamate hydrolase family protein [Deltaproteobacteria bacterium]|jgi:phage replication-related protein YjqB (UPF0714/DUF867 family)|nr:poly-gamma-glutamate hydrolase family protein [Deltaproteobacteria bacterium]
MQPYGSFKELKENEIEGEDYRIHFREGKTGILIMAPHAGDIEPATGELADAIAGGEHSFYGFWGLKAKHNSVLHIDSTRFDEPLAVDLVKKSQTVLTIHGSKETQKIIFVGGRNTELKQIIQNGLQQLGIPLGESLRLPGIKADNICNRSRSGQGVQLEISAGLRIEFFKGVSGAAPDHSTRHFVKLVDALRAALNHYLMSARK